MNATSSSPTRDCNPAEFCSVWESAVNVLSVSTFAAKSGWARNNSNCFSRGAVSTTTFKASASSVTVDNLDRSSTDVDSKNPSAAQGLCSYNPPSASMISSFRFDNSSATVGRQDVDPSEDPMLLVGVQVLSVEEDDDDDEEDTDPNTKKKKREETNKIVVVLKLMDVFICFFAVAQRSKEGRN